MSSDAGSIDRAVTAHPQDLKHGAVTSIVPNSEFNRRVRGFPSAGGGPDSASTGGAVRRTPPPDPEPGAAAPQQERLAMLIDREEVDRHNAALAQRLRLARLRQAVCLEDIDYNTPRGLDRTLIRSLA